MTDQQPDAVVPAPEDLIEKLADAVRRSRLGPLDGREYAAAAHVMDVLAETVYPALGADAQQMIGIVVAQLREARETADALRVENGHLTRDLGDAYLWLPDVDGSRLKRLQAEARARRTAGATS